MRPTIIHFNLFSQRQISVQWVSILYYMNIIVYGISELLDHQPNQTHTLLQTVASSLPINSNFFIVDPLSHQFCCEKEFQIQSSFTHHPTSSFVCSSKGHCKVSVSRSILEPAIQSYCNLLHLQINRDIKLSCHVWFQLLHKTSETPSNQPLIQSNVEKVLILTQLPCVNEWKRKISGNCQTNVWQLRDSTESENLALYNRLIDCWSKYGGVLCIPYIVYSFIFIHYLVFILSVMFLIHLQRYCYCIIMIITLKL